MQFKTAHAYIVMNFTRLEADEVAKKGEKTEDDKFDDTSAYSHSVVEIDRITNCI